MNQISNQDLKLDEIPDPDGNWNQWGSFALTINGYEVQGGFEACADLANGGEAKTLTELRCALFFEARRERHSGGMTDVVAQNVGICCITKGDHCVITSTAQLSCD